MIKGVGILLFYNFIILMISSLLLLGDAILVMKVGPTTNNKKFMFPDSKKTIEIKVRDSYVSSTKKVYSYYLLLSRSIFRFKLQRRWNNKQTKTTLSSQGI